MLVLSLDISTKTGWALFKDRKLIEYGQLDVGVKDFNVNKHPEKAGTYPWNLFTAAEDMAGKITQLGYRLKPDKIVIENTVRGRNRHTQRILEWIHFAVLKTFGNGSVQVPSFCDYQDKIVYMDVSEWRSRIQLWMTNEDKKNNKEVKAGNKKGKITKKHLAVRYVNKTFDLKLKLKDNNIADAIAMCDAFFLKTRKVDVLE